MSALLDAIAVQDSAAALRALDEDGEVDATAPDGTSALLLARYRGLTEVAAAISTRRAISLAEAAAIGDVRAVGDLLASGINPEERSPDGFTPLQLACHFDNPAAAAVLLRAGADVSARASGRMDVQPIHAAAASPTGSCMALVVAAGADLDATQAGGFTALHEAAMRGDPAMVELLLAAGATAGAKADDGRDAADMAEAEGAAELARRLRAPAAP